MIIVTTPFLAGHRIVETKGMVFGLVVRSRGIGGTMSEIVAYGTAVITEPDPGAPQAIE